MADAPTIAEAKAAYYASADYDMPGGSLEMAYAFIKACRQLLILLSKRVSHGGRAEESEIDPTVIERQIVAAKQWCHAQGSRSASQRRHIFRRDDSFMPTYPGPYYG
jgi:hypothetical protein